VQGIDCDARVVWVTSVDRESQSGYLQEFLLSTGEMLRQTVLRDGPRYHPGGITVDGDSIWIPLAEYRRQSSSVIQRRNRRTLELESQFPVADHIGCVAVAGDRVIGGNWDSREFYVWDREGRPIEKVPNSTGVAYQDMKFTGRRIVAGGLLPDRTGAIAWLEFPGFRLVRRIEVGKTDRGVPFTNEGLAAREGELLLLPEDAPSRLFVFRLPE
jgi:hypothetical protein